MNYYKHPYINSLLWISRKKKKECFYRLCSVTLASVKYFSKLWSFTHCQVFYILTITSIFIHVYNEYILTFSSLTVKLSAVCLCFFFQGQYVYILELLVCDLQLSSGGEFIFLFNNIFLGTLQDVKFHFNKFSNYTSKINQSLFY